MFTRPTRPFACSAWLALWAMLAMALLPTVSHALAFARGGASNWVEVCTPQGMRLMAVAVADGADGAPAPAPVQAAGHLEHCPLCALGGDLPPLPAAAPAALLPPHSAALPSLFLQAPYAQQAWRSAQPRGPPSRP